MRNLMKECAGKGRKGLQLIEMDHNAGTLGIPETKRVRATNKIILRKAFIAEPSSEIADYPAIVGMLRD
jgi:hypothetical protein